MAENSSFVRDWVAHADGVLVADVHGSAELHDFGAGDACNDGLEEAVAAAADIVGGDDIDDSDRNPYDGLVDAHRPFGGGDEEDNDDIHAVVDDGDSFDRMGDDDTADVAAVDGDTYDDVDIVADSTAPLRP